MNSPQTEVLWNQVLDNQKQECVLRLAMQYAEYALCKMTERPFHLDHLDVKKISLNRLDSIIGDPESETVAVYLSMSAELPGQSVFILTMADAICLSEWLLGLNPGTITTFDPLTSSALAEVGNVILSSFLNAIAQLTDVSLGPSPPEVAVDMLATTLQVVATWIAPLADDLLILEATFVHSATDVEIRFWLLPNPNVVDKLCLD